MSTQNMQVALVQFGYQTYAVPVDSLSATLAHFAAMRKVDSRYEKNGYVYWYGVDKDSDLPVTIVSASRIHDADPGNAPVASPPVPVATPVDSRVIAAPSDTPITIQNVPPMRDFVDEYRHEDILLARVIGDLQSEA